MKFPTLKDELVRTPERDATVWRPPNREQIERLRKMYPAGTVVELVEMQDSQAPPTGTLGTVLGRGRCRKYPLSLAERLVPQPYPGGRFLPHRKGGTP